MLEDRDRGGGEYRDGSQYRETERKWHRTQRKLHTEDRKHEPQQYVYGNLGGGGGQKCTDGRGSVGIGIGQPQVQREERNLEPETYGQEGETGTCRPGVGHVRQPLREIKHIERPSQRVQQANTDQDKRGADGPHDEVLVGCGQRPAVSAHRNKRVTGKR